MNIELPFRSFVFDFDGTLVQSNAIKRNGFFEVSKALQGAEETLESILLDRDPGDRSQVFETLVTRLERGNASTLTMAYTQYCQHEIGRCDEVPGARALLQALNQDSRWVFVNSGTPEDALQAVVRLRGYEEYLDGIFGRPSSKPENLLRALDASGSTAQDCVLIGDSESDRAAAEETGCAFIGMRSDENDFTVRPKYLLDDLTPIVHSLAAGKASIGHKNTDYSRQTFAVASARGGSKGVPFKNIKERKGR